MINNNNNQVKGLILTSIGVLAIVPDSILIRLIQADILTITFWRAARVERIYDGTSEIQRHIISRELLRPLGS